MFKNLEIQQVREVRQIDDRYYLKNYHCNTVALILEGTIIYGTGRKKVFLNNTSIYVLPQAVGVFKELHDQLLIIIDFSGEIPYKRLTGFGQTEKTRQLFFDILQLYRKRTVHSLCMAHAKLYELFCELYTEDDVAIERDVISRGLERLNTHFADPELKIDTVAKLIGVSPEYFRREFKKRNNIGPKEYLLRLRLEHAAALLKEGGRSVEEAAYQSGFSTPSYFSVAFKRKFGVPPLEYSRSSREPKN